MEDSLHKPQKTLSLDAEKRIDRICLEFEKTWQSGVQPQVEQFLENVPPPERSQLLLETLIDEAIVLEKGKSPAMIPKTDERFATLCRFTRTRSQT